MTAQGRANNTLQPIAGGSLIGLGLHILCGNLDRVAAQFPFLGATGEEPGGLSSVIFAASQAMQAHALDQQDFLQGLLRVFVLFWPLILVVAGTILSRHVLTDEAQALPTTNEYFLEKTGRRVDFTSFRSTYR
jgi:hypothetical protein